MARRRKPNNSIPQEPVPVSPGTAEDLRVLVEDNLAQYRGRTYSGGDLQAAREDKTALTRLRKTVEQRRRDLKQSRRLTPELDTQLRALTARIDEPLAPIQRLLAQADEEEKEKRYRDLKKYYNRVSGGLGDLAEPLYHSPAFLDRRWENRNMTPKTWRAGIQSKVTKAALDLQVLQNIGGEDAPALIARYLETMDLNAVLRYKEVLEKVRQAGDRRADPGPSENNVVGWRTLKLRGTARQMAQLDKQLALLGIGAQELENGMPQPPRELTVPDFDSFVCVDIENSGSYGLAHGDTPAEITEIGAVRVEHGKIVDRKSWLCNPKRKIIPTVVKLTGITNEMVAKAPPVSQVIRQYAAYIDGLPVVGHNIRGDLPYLLRAAGRVGVALPSPYFDTYFYAKKLNERWKWDGIGLESLAQQFGIPHPNAHRALSDAEANAALYLILRGLSASAPHEDGLTPE